MKGPPGLKTLAALAMQPPKWYGSAMGKSSIAKQLRAGAGSTAALELGRRVRERRLAVGMTQSELAAPLSRAFVSAVEKGHALPSLGALWLFAARLGIGVGNLVDGVNGVATPEYTASHDDRTIHAEPGSSHRPTTASHRR
jgi:DNA-binding XRE family transcriptional regulator